MSANPADIPRMTNAELKTNMYFYRSFDAEKAGLFQAEIDRRGRL